MIPISIQHAPDPFVDLGAVPIVQSLTEEIDRDIPGGLGYGRLPQHPSNLPAVHTDGIRHLCALLWAAKKEDRAARIHALQFLNRLFCHHRGQDDRPGPIPDFPFHQLHLLCLVMVRVKGDEADVPVEFHRCLIHALFEIHIVVIIVPVYDDGNRVYLNLLFLDDKVRGGHQEQQDQDTGPYAPENFPFI